MHNNSTNTALEELAHIAKFYLKASEAQRAFAWGLLQLAPRPETRPALVSLMLALNLLENEDAKEEMREAGEEPATQEQLIVGFWKGSIGVVEDSSLVEETPESERGAITSAARVLFALPQLVTGTLSPEIEAEVEHFEQSSGTVRTVSECEHDLLVWLKDGITPAHPYSAPDFILEALDPKDGGSTLETVNRLNLVWWHSMKRLQARLLEFAALEIPAPQELTEADLEAMRREIEEEGTEQHLSRV